MNTVHEAPHWTRERKDHPLSPRYRSRISVQKLNSKLTKDKVRASCNHKAEDILFCCDEKYVNKAIKAVSRQVRFSRQQFGKKSPNKQVRNKTQPRTENRRPFGFPLVFNLSDQAATAPALYLDTNTWETGTSRLASSGTQTAKLQTPSQ